MHDADIRGVHFSIKTGGFILWTESIIHSGRFSAGTAVC